MGLLRLAALGAPEVFHNESRLIFPLRKAQALLLYLAVEGGMHSRSKLAALLWPNSEAHDARTALRNAISLLRNLLDDSNSSPAQHLHLLSEHDLLGLNPQAPLELDLDMVQLAWQQAQMFSTTPSEAQRAALIAQVQQAVSLMRGPFLDGFWLREETDFDEWRTMHQHQWQVRLQQLLERLSSWQEEALEREQAQATLVRWLELDPLAEEAYRRLMRLHLTRGDHSAALQVYATCQARLAEALQVDPSPETITLAELIRSDAVHRSTTLTLPSSIPVMESRQQTEVVVPLVGRAAPFTQLINRYQQARQGLPQAVLIVGEAGIGKTRLASEFVSWARAQGADVLSGQAFEVGGRLPYQPLVEAIRLRLEEENAPEDLLEDPWLIELSRILPELRVRYPDLPAPTGDELTSRVRLFEAVARLLDALAQRRPLVLVLDDLQWVDVASLDLVRYLGRHWKGHGMRALLLSTVRSEGLGMHPELVAQLADLERDLPVTRVELQALSEEETIRLIQAIVVEGESGECIVREKKSRREKRRHAHVHLSAARPVGSPSQEPETPLIAIGCWLFAHTGGHPFYLLEMLKMFRDRGWLVPRQGTDGNWMLEFSVAKASEVAQVQSQRELLPASVRAMILARQSRLTPGARELVRAGAVLGNQASAAQLWQVAEMNGQAAIEALEEVIGSGILREEQAGGDRRDGYRFTHDLMRDVVYTEMGEARRRLLHQRAFALLLNQGARASELAYHARASGEARDAYRYSVQAGDEAMGVFAVEDAMMHYEQARSMFQEHQQMQASLSALDVEHLYVSLAQAYSFLSEWDKAQEAYEELIAYAQHQGLPTLVSMSLNRLALLVALESNDKPKARTLLMEAWRMAEISHDQRVLAETQWSLALMKVVGARDSKGAFLYGEHALELARAAQHKELEARCLSLFGMIHTLGGNFQEAIQCLDGALALYATLGNELTDVQEFAVTPVMSGAPPIPHLMSLTTEALCWTHLALAQLNCGLVQDSIHSSRRALSLAQEVKNVWVQLTATAILTYGLQEVGANEEAFVLMQQGIAQVQTLPVTRHNQRFLVILGSAYHALHQWEEARRILEEVEAVTEALELGGQRVSHLSLLCMNYVQVGEWELAHSYALKAVVARKRHDGVLIPLDFYRHYETEALLRGGDDSLAREEVQRLEEGVGPYRRFRIPYRRSLAVLATWDGHSEQAIDHLCEAGQIAADLGLPAERWQIQAELGQLYEAEGRQAQARTAFGEAATILQGLAQDIRDEARRAHFLAAPQVQQVLRQARGEVSQVSHREKTGPLRR